MSQIPPNNTQLSYDRVAAEYARRFQDELSKKPFDRKMLAWLVERVDHRGVICDLGCGPGQVASYLHQQGAAVCGIDLSQEMIAQARQLYPHIPFQQGDMRALSAVADASFAGIAAFYAIIHIPPAQMHQTLREMRRVLCDEGVLLVTFHIGDEVRHFDEWWEQKVDLDFIFFQTQQVKTYLHEAGFKVTEALERDPYPDIEVQTRRAYLFAVKPGSE